MALARTQTLKDLATPTLDQQPFCIDMPQLEVAFELKSRMIHLLPTFHGLSGEDRNKNLKEFHVVCSSRKPLEIFMEQDNLEPSIFPCPTMPKNGSITFHMEPSQQGMR